MRFSFYFWSFAEIADIYFLWVIKFFSLRDFLIARGIERKRIFTDGVDRDNFLNRPGKL